MEKMDRRRFGRTLTAAAVASLPAGSALGKKSHPALDGELRIPPAGSVIPGGWIREQLENDLIHGITGHYDEINDTVDRDLFGANKERSSDQFFVAGKKPWWSGEHEGYWKDAVTRAAFLTRQKEYMDTVRGWMERVLEYQSPDGYIGIYPPDNRYNHKRENGELWTQSRLFVAMLAYHEYTGDKDVLEAVDRAVRLTMSKYPSGRGYFKSAGPTTHSGGLSHGLAFCDVLEWMHRKTRDEDFLNYAEFLYRDFDHCRFNDDMSLRKLRKARTRFMLHGPHVCEHFMVPFFLGGETGKEEFLVAANNAIRKLRRHLTPSGCLVSSENVNGRPGAADSFYEYCCITELAIGMNRVAQYGHSLEAFDLVEKMTFNGGQGARFPLLDSCSYLTSDNREQINPHGHLGRQIYSPSHSAAACCTLNAGRLMPYYVEGMWMKWKDEGVAACMYGPCVLETIINGIQVRIKEETSYPFSDEILFEIEPEKAARFSLFLRKPAFARELKLDTPPGTRTAERDGFIELERPWSPGERVRLKMELEVLKVPILVSWKGRRKGVCFQRGPLLYGLRFPIEVENGREHGDSGFYDKVITCTDQAGWEYRVPHQAEFEFTRVAPEERALPWRDPPVALEGEMVNARGKARQVTLVPQGATVLRRMGFAVKE